MRYGSGRMRYGGARLNDECRSSPRANEISYNSSAPLSPSTDLVALGIFAHVCPRQSCCQARGLLTCLSIPRRHPSRARQATLETRDTY
ncbi:Hypothetical protein NTJ_08568 [Nesidiocoris tenuis]|uniref:Uncharacterized protein n=1 Tax=Nesidiocoris tenuis TaxID=355587 RepID=A0ABN7AWR7_9HEMI|nr:Hypothetical protein NTJ_08568 [Nesidiocoris tenuis]